MFPKFYRLTLLASIVGLALAACGAAPSSSWSGVALSNDSAVLYVTAGTHIYAIATDGSGKQIWLQPNATGGGGGFLGLFGGGDSSTPNTAVALAQVYANPVVAGDLVIASSFDKHSAYALNAKDGLQKWVFPAAGDTVKPEDRLIAGPAVHGDTVYVASADNSLYAVSLADGKFKWSYKTGNSLWATPLATDTLVYVPSMDHNLYALDPAGNLKWKKELDGALAGSPTLSADGKTLFIGSLNNTLYALDAVEGSQLWTITTHGWVWTTPVVADGVIYFGDLEGTVFAADSATGAVKWKAELGGSIRGTPALSGSTLIVALDEQGKVYALNTADGAQKWEHEIDPSNADRLLSDLLVVGDRVIVTPIAAANLVYALNIGDGSVAWTYKP